MKSFITSTYSIVYMNKEREEEKSICLCLTMK